MPVNGVNKPHCCARMAIALAPQVESDDERFADPDVLVWYSEQLDEYGIIVHDGGSSTVEICFCPWCGTKLPPSARDRWFDELEAKGVDPTCDPMPSAYETTERRTMTFRGD